MNPYRSPYPDRKAPEEMQRLIDEMAKDNAPHAKMVKTKLHITRYLEVRQYWELEVMMPENDAALNDEIVQQIDCAGLDWGEPTYEKTEDCDDTLEWEQ
jgi:hypothetical protein